LETPLTGSGLRVPANESTEVKGVVAVPILSLQPGDSPRLNGEDKAHIARLAESEAEMPPILVDKRTMQVIDGMHRLMAAALQGRSTIDVTFYEGDPADVFLRALKENTAHGLPLSHADRRAAAQRIMKTHPHMSDPAIGEAAGLAAKTVAAIRRSSGAASQPDARVGKDGRVRPVNGEEGRRRAAAIIARQPTASLREVASAAGISPATALDVRNRLAAGESPLPSRPRGAGRDRRQPEDSARNGAEPERQASEAGGNGAAAPSGRRAPASDSPTQPPLQGDRAVRAPGPGQPPPAEVTVKKLLRDPSLRGTESGRLLLRLLQITSVAADRLPLISTGIPPHCVRPVEQVARQYAQLWQDFAADLGRRSQIVNPAGQ
jgi:ParB-like chromosome segregation protein Spo0J